MLHRQSIGLGAAQRAVEAALAEGRRDGRALAVAVADDRGDLVACARMDGAPERVLRFCIRKAYAAAVMGRDTLELKRELEERGRTLADYGDPQLTTLQGGVAVVFDGRVVGAVAVGGNPQSRDEEIARVAVRALGLGD